MYVGKCLHMCLCGCAYMHCSVEGKAQYWKSDGSDSNDYTSLSLRVPSHKMKLISSTS